MINFLGCTATSTSGQFSEMSIKNRRAIGMIGMPKSSIKSNTAPLSSLVATNLKLCQFDAETKTESSSKSLPSQMKTSVKKGNINFTYNLALAFVNPSSLDFQKLLHLNCSPSPQLARF